jgi:hypothetical protein
VNDDGFDDLLVGAPDYETTLPGEGQVYLYLGGPDGLSTVPADQGSSQQSIAYLGRFVGPAGDTNGDGFDDVLLGAVAWDDIAVDGGLAAVVLGSASGIADLPDYEVAGPGAGDQYGWAIGPRAGDANGDGYGDILFGGRHAEGTQVDEGIAIVFYGSAIGITGAGTTSTESNQNNAETGSAVCWGNVNGDAYSDALIAANLHSGPGVAVRGLRRHGRKRTIRRRPRRRRSRR